MPPLNGQDVLRKIAGELRTAAVDFDAIPRDGTLTPEEEKSRQPLIDDSTGVAKDADDLASQVADEKNWPHTMPVQSAPTTPPVIPPEKRPTQVIDASNNIVTALVDVSGAMKKPIPDGLSGHLDEVAKLGKRIEAVRVNVADSVGRGQPKPVAAKVGAKSAIRVALVVTSQDVLREVAGQLRTAAEDFQIVPASALKPSEEVKRIALISDSNSAADDADLLADAAAANLHVPKTLPIAASPKVPPIPAGDLRPAEIIDATDNLVHAMASVVALKTSPPPGVGGLKSDIDKLRAKISTLETTVANSVGRGKP